MVNKVKKIYESKELISAISDNLFLELKNYDIDIYNKFLIRAAMQSGDLLNIHSISNSMGISRNKIE